MKKERDSLYLNLPPHAKNALQVLNDNPDWSWTGFSYAMAERYNIADLEECITCLILARNNKKGEV